ncbi:YbhB/YbcL family Raf kinase inhibitor-like protein [Sphingomonas sp. 8AM]|uniref:YbhB/YbcL family Raf kinase inhibitor-like protein n=1 Tax=Sphingomonas sp. 8AM TaxID=2653170 RepID=UPI003FA6C579
MPAASKGVEPSSLLLAPFAERTARSKDSEVTSLAGRWCARRRGPATPVAHWVAWNVPRSTTRPPDGLQERHRPNGGPLEGIMPGASGRGTVGWYGPRPPKGDTPHHYHFQVLALDRALDVPLGATRDRYSRRRLGASSRRATSWEHTPSRSKPPHFQGVRLHAPTRRHGLQRAIAPPGSVTANLRPSGSGAPE